jgi:hypothetical protein
LNVNKGEHPRFGIFRLPDDWSANILWQYKTGRPFTPAAGYPGLVLRRNESPQTNSKRMPATSSVDIGIDKNFQIYGINYTLKLLINNAFDTRNVDFVYTSTGLAYSNINNNGLISTGRPNDLDPTNYTSGRQIIVGLGIQF